MGDRDDVMVQMDGPHGCARCGQTWAQLGHYIGGHYIGGHYIGGSMGRYGQMGHTSLSTLGASISMQPNALHDVLECVQQAQAITFRQEERDERF